MILSVNKNYGHKISFSSSDLLWVSEDVIIERDGIDVLDKNLKRTGEVTSIWRAYFSICIFGKEPMICQDSFGRGIDSIDEAKKDAAYCSLKFQHEQIIKALSQK